MFPGLSNIEVIHPLFVHFPIAFLVAALVAETVFWIRGSEGSRSFSEWMLILGIASAAAAIFSGFRDASHFGHDAPGHELVHIHRDLMIWTTVVFAAAGILMFAAHKWRKPMIRRLVILPLISATVLLLLGADRGAELVYYYGHGVRQQKIQHETSHNDPSGSKDQIPDESEERNDSTKHDHTH